MFNNRLNRDAQQPEQAARPKPGPTVPKGFVALPEQFHQGADIQGQLYRQAYEQACRQAREKLLNLLRSRARMLNDDSFR